MLSVYLLTACSFDSFPTLAETSLEHVISTDNATNPRLSALCE
jgi:hypothetical protein